ncbi:MAG TPA: hypothetical protein VGC13_14030 [Longimicrobium sp.]|jgi:hypothetical protein|uniref:hypothetical protein n=1 Tax=Longimicrobium sp. TaxID=2029185 RepID=UPI002EDA4D9B
MRRTRYLFPVAAVLALAGFGRATRAETTLTVNGVYCNNNGGGTFGCYVDVSGGSGTYVSYALSWTQHRLGYWYGPFTASGSGPYVSGNCTVGWTLQVTATVTDSQSATATGTGTHICRSAAD